MPSKSSKKKASARRRKNAENRARATGDSLSVKMPGGGIIDLSMPEPKVMDLFERMRVGIPPTRDELETALGWMAGQPIGYQVYALEAMRNQVVMMMGAKKAIRSGQYQAQALDMESLRILRDLSERVESGTLGMCKHVRALAPAPASWVAWMPDKVRCPQCAEEACKGIRGTKEDTRCDECGNIHARISTNVAQILPTNLSGVVVPMLLTFGLCDRCHQRAQESAIPDTSGPALKADLSALLRAIEQEISKLTAMR